MDPQIKSLLTTVALAASTSFATWAASKGIIPSGDQSVFANELMFALSGGVTLLLAWWARRQHSQVALIAAVNDSSNGVKVVANSPANATVPVVREPLAGPAAKVVALLVFGGLLALATAHPAFAQRSKGGFKLPIPLPTGTVAPSAKKLPADPIAVIQAFTVQDLQNALADAQSPVSPLPAGCTTGSTDAACITDPTAAACYTALIPYVQANVNNPLPTKLGAFLAFQKARDLKVILNQGIPSAINTACAPLVLDAANTIIGLGAKVGIGIALPAGLPFGL